MPAAFRVTVPAAEAVAKLPAALGVEAVRVEAPLLVAAAAVSEGSPLLAAAATASFASCAFSSGRSLWRTLDFVSHHLCGFFVVS